MNKVIIKKRVKNAERLINTKQKQRHSRAWGFENETRPYKRQKQRNASRAIATCPNTRPPIYLFPFHTPESDTKGGV